MTSKGSRLETFFRIETPYLRSEVLGGCENETGIAGPLNTPNHIKVTCQIPVEDKWRVFKPSTRIRPRNCRGLPELQPSSDPNGEVTTGWRELECVDWTFEGKVIYDNTPPEIRQNRMSIFINGEEKVSLWS